MTTRENGISAIVPLLPVVVDPNAVRAESRLGRLAAVARSATVTANVRIPSSRYASRLKRPSVKFTLPTWTLAAARSSSV